MKNPYLDVWREAMGLQDDQLFETWCNAGYWDRGSIVTEPHPKHPFLRRSMWCFELRFDLVKEYAWAIPTEAICKKIAECSPIVEIGCGTGYWKWCIEQCGGKVHAIDKFPAGCKHFTNGKHWSEVCGGTADSLARFKHNYTLMLCWPPYEDSMAHDALCKFRGDKLIYIGEFGGCTGDEAFHNLLEEEWEEVEHVEIVSYECIRDTLMIFRRRKPRSRHWTFYGKQHNE